MQSEIDSPRTAVILGLGRQGIALARFLAERGTRVRVSDLRPASELAAAMAVLEDLTIEYVLGNHPESLLDGAGALFLSGGVPADAPLVRAAQARDIHISNDSQLFLDNAPCHVIGVTGSAGKTTTTALLGRMGAASGRAGKTWVGGNIGNPLLADIGAMRAQDLAVMELSSFQLEIMTASPPTAAVLNLTPNHLDRHGAMEAYAAAKARILDFQSATDTAVLGRDDSGARALADSVIGTAWWFSAADAEISRGGFVCADKICVRAGPMEKVAEIAALTDVRLRGAHNLQNVLAACTLAAVVDIEPRAMREAIRSFTGVPHRLELVREWNGSAWINDSIATAPERTVAAVRSFEEPLLLLLGGRDKNLPWGELASLVRRRVRRIILFGEAAELIGHNLSAAPARKEHDPSNPVSEDKGSGDQPKIEGSTAGEANEHPDPFPLPIHRAESMAAAVRRAAQLAQPGDVVLLSPGCTSFDEFRNFEERGEAFRKYVNEME